MKEERLMILNLLNEGKINADEAAKLLDALGKAAGTEDKRFRHGNARSGFYHAEMEDRDVEEKLKKFSQAVDNFSKDFGEKVSGTFKDLEPKFRRTAKTAMEKAAAVVDDLAKSLNESVRNMEERMKADCCEDDCCEDDCCDDGNDSCCANGECRDDEPRQN